MAARERPTCSSEEGISPANKQGSSSDSSTPSKGEEEETPRPTKKNKRKMSAPRKRTDVSSKRFCLSDKVTELYADDDDDMMDDVKQLPPHTPEPSPSSDERNNSVENGASPSPVLVPPAVPPQLLGPTVPGLYQTPVITSVGGVPRYTLFPGLPPGFFPAPGLVPPGFVPVIPGATRLPSPSQDERSLNSGVNTSHCSNSSKEASPSSCPTSVPSPSPSVSSGLEAESSISGSRKQRKNYKNMTRERRIEANARERTRVHTISAAFESLRRAVPSYSYHQRLSKLAILRIACSYIMSLSRLADSDYSEDQTGLSFADCVDLCTQTIQSEGRAKRRQ